MLAGNVRRYILLLSFSFNECLFYFYFLFCHYLCLYVFEKKKKSHPPWMFKKPVRKVTFLTLFKRVYHWSEREPWVLFTDYLPLFTCGVNFHIIFNNYLYLRYVMGCFSCITFDTSWWLSSDCHPILFFSLSFFFSDLWMVTALQPSHLVSPVVWTERWKTHTCSFLFISSDIAEVLSQY